MCTKTLYFQVSYVLSGQGIIFFNIKVYSRFPRVGKNVKPQTLEGYNFQNNDFRNFFFAPSFLTH